MKRRYRTVLSIAGSDSIGGAGIQADIKTCCAHSVYAMTAITAVTAQNTEGVRCYEAVSPELLDAQLRAVCSDVMPDAVKIGMVPDATSANIIADNIERYSLLNIVLDPVMIATSGDQLNDGSTLEAIKSRIIPKSTIVTPNIPEAQALYCVKSDIQEAITEMAESLLCNSLLIKGGHKEGDIIEDVLWDDGMIHRFEHKRVDTPNTHGTGCTLSTAIACNLAKGMDEVQACEKAIAWLYNAICVGSEYQLGHGRGPVSHFQYKLDNF